MLDVSVVSVAKTIADLSADSNWGQDRVGTWTLVSFPKLSRGLGNWQERGWGWGGVGGWGDVQD